MLDLLVTDTPDLTLEDVRKIAAGTRLGYARVLRAPTNGLVHPYTWNATLHMAIKELRVSGCAYFTWIENDNLLNSNWYSGLRALLAQAEAVRPVGLAAPNRLADGKHPHEDPGEHYGFLLLKEIPTTIFLVRSEVILAVPEAVYTSRRCEKSFTRSIREQGRDHIMPRVSMSQHIGRSGMTRNQRWENSGRGGIGFVPDPEIAHLWAQFNE